MPRLTAHLAVPYGGRQDTRLEPKYIQGHADNHREAVETYKAHVQRVCRAVESLLPCF
jgi:hypothetical protein